MPERILCYLALGGNIGVTYPMSNTLLRTLSALKRHTFCRTQDEISRIRKWKRNVNTLNRCGNMTAITCFR